MYVRCDGGGVARFRPLTPHPSLPQSSIIPVHYFTAIATYAPLQGALH